MEKYYDVSASKPVVKMKTPFDPKADVDAYISRIGQKKKKTGGSDKKGTNKVTISLPPSETKVQLKISHQESEDKEPKK